MKVTPTEGGIKGVPDYYNVYRIWHQEYLRAGDPRAKTLAIHYAIVAEEMGQAIIEDDATTHEVTYEAPMPTSTNR